MNSRFKSFKEFYPFYLSEHLNPICRLLHFIGTSLVITLIIISIIYSNTLFIYSPLCGYSFAFIGHFVFEKNQDNSTDNKDDSELPKKNKKTKKEKPKKKKK